MDWDMVDRPSIAVIGQSHTHALRRGMPEDDRFGFIDTNTVVPSWIGPDGRIRADFLAGYDPDAPCISMLGGNFHTVFGLVEHRIRFDFFSPLSAGMSADTARQIIPFHLLRETFRKALEPGVFAPMTQLRDYFRGRMIHLCSPPYFPSSEHVHKFPYYFKDKLEYGVSPVAVRKKLYDLHSHLIAEHCRQIGVQFVSPPAEAVDGDGRLLPEYWAEDSSHANTRYGALLYRQVSEVLAP